MALFNFIILATQPRAPSGALPHGAQVKLMLAALGIAVVLLGALIVITTIRRAARARRDIDSKRRVMPPISPWEAAGQRAKPLDDDPDRTRPVPGTEPLDDR
ncbi:MAG: hypothetical protein ACKVZJ_02510 [Phycisphaerales bacterium]